MRCFEDYHFYKESAMIVIRSIASNSTITKLYLSVILYKDDINFVTTQAKNINSMRKSHNKDIVVFELLFYDLKDKSSIGEYNIKDQ